MKNQLLFSSLLALFLLCFACESPQYQFREHAANLAGINFQNTITENEQYNMVNYPYVYNGGGVGIADLDGDGLPEIFFTGNQQASRLYKNLGNWKFKDITSSAGIELDGWCTGVTFADVNADGLLDIYVCRSGNVAPEQRSNRCFLNQGNLQFQEAAAELGIDDKGWSTQSAFFDYDRDGDLDLYVLNHTNDDRYPNRIKSNRKRNSQSSASDKLYRNDNGHFSDVSAVAGIGDDGWGLGLGLGDFNQDGYIDLYVSNDFLANDILYLNQRNGTFKDYAAAALGHTSHFSMGNDVADFDNDGLTDFFVADMMPSTNVQRKKMAGVLSPQAYAMVLANGYTPQYMRNTLQKNLGIYPDSNSKSIPLFTEIGQLAGVNATDWSWNPLFCDLDGDGWKDLFITNGYRHDIIDMDFILQNNELGKAISLQAADQQIKQKARLQPGYTTVNQFFKNNGNLRFSNQTHNWISAQSNFSNGAAYGDLDNDGDPDLVVNNMDALPSLYENKTRDARWLKITLQDQAPNTLAFGASVQVFLPGQPVQQQQVFSTRGFQSASSTELMFGLGKNDHVDSLWITWPNGQKQRVLPPDKPRTLNIRHRGNDTPLVATKTTSIFSVSTLATSWRHQESPFIDFNYEPLLLHTFSNEGPPICQGDLNNDGLIDVFVGGAAGQSGCFLIQQKNGKFTTLLLQKGDMPEEDSACTFFDADGDGDLDLYLASGSDEYPPNDPAYQDRLYLNQGNNRWELTNNRLPLSFSPSSTVTAADFDQDGDQDLFVGGRRNIAHYGVAGNSQLLVNDGRGFFSDATNQLAPGLKNCGMVTAAKWVDLDGNDKLDLIVAGELMPISIWYNFGLFEKKVIKQTEGFWNSLDFGDLDQDGDLDLVTGNLGTNHKFNISPKSPLQLYGADFDGNGYYEALITYYINGQQTPIHSREDINRQIPPLRKKFSTYQAYANAPWSQIITPKQLKTALTQKAVCTQSAWFENQGKGKMSFHALPLPAQTAPINSLVIDDIDADGRLDLLCVGNQHGWEVSSGKMDAGIGWVIHNLGKGKFAVVPPAQSGFWIPGESRNICKIKQNPATYLIARNNEQLLLVEKK